LEDRQRTSSGSVPKQPSTWPMRIPWNVPDQPLLHVRNCSVIKWNSEASLTVGPFRQH
jgi:hypothetical protein